ncbi:GGDEF domain-containing protein [Acuticoccus sediminis]|uniref:diguanylate cyclase n=1 Tax=Acuticoccus sediminis TaxID=2184697 RepID=A0A8B2NV67_9HYPH|nr:GGDEF domain-containing protein [Acuticoccus sediminis]RAI01063.1 GGDEF domain-containing protein [Acuticoccus sediminis]
MATDAAFAIAQGALYYGVMLTLFRCRDVFGVGTFCCALCALTFVETYLAATVYVGVADIMYTPGSVILFAGKLPLLLLVYIREDAETVRQPIYGLFFGNLLIVGLLLLIGQQTAAPMLGGEKTVQIVVDSASLTVWGTFLLFVDCIAVILLYERLSRIAHMPLFVRVWLSTVVILAADHVLFFAALHIFFDVPVSAGYGGFVGKMAAAFFYSTLISLYLHFAERAGATFGGSIADVFDVLTYRQRYEALHVESLLDVLTGVRNRRALTREGERYVDEALAKKSHLGLLAVDLDNFKSVNDRHGHMAGDEALCFLADLMRGTVRSTDQIYRIGGDEFLIVLPNCDPPSASSIAAKLRDLTRNTRMARPPYSVSASIGWADLGTDGASLGELITAADRRLYEAKANRSMIPVTS